MGRELLLIVVVAAAACCIAGLVRLLVLGRGSAAGLRLRNEELRCANVDLVDGLALVAGLAVNSHEGAALESYLETSLGTLLAADVEVAVGNEPLPDSTVLEANGAVVGSVRVRGGDAERWSRLHELLAPRLAAAFASTLAADELRRRSSDRISALSRTIEAREMYAGVNAERVARIAVGLARKLGFSGRELAAVELGALVHNVGKFGIPGSILDKPGPLDNDEWAVMKRHPAIAELVLSGLDVSPIVLEIARSSHERLDGTGYPDNLVGEAIPLPARIVLVAEAFDALTTNRPYRRARRAPAAIAEIAAHAGTQFCPLVVEALERLYNEDPAALGDIGRLTVVA